MVAILQKKNEEIKEEKNTKHTARAAAAIAATTQRPEEVDTQIHLDINAIRYDADTQV